MPPPIAPYRLTDTQKALAASRVALAVKLAVRFADRRGLDREDCISEATFRLLRAAYLFDPERGFTFTTYAHKAITHSLWRWADQEHTRRRLPTVPLSSFPDRYDLADNRPGPASLADRELAGRALAAMPRRHRAMARAKWMEVRTLAEIAAEHGITKERVRQLLQRARRQALAHAPSEGGAL